MGPNTSRFSHVPSSVISIGDRGQKQCQECSATFSSSDVHSCVNYLQKLLKVIVGETAFSKAQIAVDTTEQSISPQKHKLGYELGTLEELMQDSFVGFRNRMERSMAELSD